MSKNLRTTYWPFTIRMCVPQISNGKFMKQLKQKVTGVFKDLKNQENGPYVHYQSLKVVTELSTNNIENIVLLSTSEQ